MKRGQFTAEFIIVLAIFLTVMATVSVPLYTSSRDTAETGTALMKAREAACEIAQALDTLYASGTIGEKKEASFWLPENTSKIKTKNGEDNNLVVLIKLNINGKERKVQSETLLPDNWAGGPVNLDSSDEIDWSGEEPIHNRIIFTLKKYNTSPIYYHRVAISEVEE